MSSRPRSPEEFLRDLSDDGSAYSSVVGTSMLPNLGPGDVLRFVPTSSDLSPGQIVAFALGGVLVVHRVVRLSGASVLCRGDNAVRNDPPVPRKAVFGRVVAVSGRLHVPDQASDVRRVRLRHALWDTTVRWRRLLGEVRLLAAQAGLGHVCPGSVLTATGFDEREALSLGLHILQPEDALDPMGTAALLASGEPVVVPAGVFNRLAMDERAALLRRLSRRETVVWAAPLTSGGRLAALMTGLRKRLATRGVAVGQPGDVYVGLRGQGRGNAGHLFTAHELMAELRAAGFGAVAVSERKTAWGVLLRAEAGPGQQP